MKIEKPYSPLIASLRDQFDHAARMGSRYLLVYWQGYGEQTDTRSTKPGQWPWAAHDEYMADDNNASILAIAFDLKESFDAQLPEHMRQFETLECFAYKPLINIPDRTGQVPAQRQQELTDNLLKPRPQLRLVR